MTQANPKYAIGQPVFDGASQMLTKIVKIEAEANNDPDDGWLYLVDTNVPLDPTGDRAFPDRWRNDFEICLPEDRARLTPFNY